MVRNIIFNSYKLTKEEKNTIKPYLSSALYDEEKEDFYEYYYYDDDEGYYQYDDSNYNIEYFDIKYSYTLVETLQDFYKAIEKGYELW